MTVNWRTSSACSKGACVHVAPAHGGVLIAQDPTAGPTLRLTHAEWAAFVAGVKAGELDLGTLDALPSATPAPAVSAGEDDVSAGSQPVPDTEE